MKRMVIFLLALFVAIPVFAIDGTQLLKEIDRNLNPESYELY
jgi:Zn-dependent protease